METTNKLIIGCAVPIKKFDLSSVLPNKQLNIIIGNEIIYLYCHDNITLPKTFDEMSLIGSKLEKIIGKMWDQSFGIYNVSMSISHDTTDWVDWYHNNN